MKKALAILLASLMLFTLFSCNTSGTPTTSASPSVTPSSAPVSASAPAETPSASAEAPTSPSAPGKAVEPGFFNPDVDYSKNPRYKVVYMEQQPGPLYDSMAKAFQLWADRQNVEFSVWCANGDMDLYITSIQTYTDQGMDGFLLDADITIYPRIGDLMTELNKPWMAGMGTPLDSDGKLNHPAVGFDFLQFGRDVAQWLCDYAKTNWPNAKPEEIGFLAHDFSVHPVMHPRVAVSEEVWNKNYPGNEKNFFVSDGASQPGAAFSADTGYNITAPIVSSHPEIKHWLVATLMDDFAIGATRALEASAKDKDSAVLCSGGSGFITQSDAGEVNCWKGALYTSEILITEPIFNGLYAQMSGQATAEDLWPDWVNTAGGEKYASFNGLNSIVITVDNYKSYLAYCDMFVGITNSKYTWDGTEFALHAEPKAS